MRSHGGRRCSRRCSIRGVITPRIYREGASRRSSCCVAAGSTTQIREPYFFGYVRDKLIEAYGAQHGSLGRAQGLHDDHPALPAAGRDGDPRTRSTSRTILPRRSSRSARAPARFARWRRSSRTARRTSSTSSRRRAASPARRSRRSCSRPRSSRASTRTRPTTSRRRSPTRCTRPGTATTAAGGACTTYANDYYGLELDPQCDAALRQLGLRAAHARRDAGEGCRRRAAHGRSLAARRERRVRAVDRPRLDRRLAARPRVRVCDARGRRRPRRADGDPPGRASRRDGRHRGRLGQAEATSRDLGGHGGRSSRASSRRTSSRARARAPPSAGRRPARPGRPRSTSTPGSPGTRLSSRRRSGSATRAARSRWRASTASRSPAGASRPRSGGSSWSRRSRAPSPRRSPTEPVAGVDAVHARRVRALVRPERLAGRPRRETSTETEPDARRASLRDADAGENGRRAGPADGRRGARAHPRARAARSRRRCRARTRPLGGCFASPPRARRPAAVSELGDGRLRGSRSATRPESFPIAFRVAAGAPPPGPLPLGAAAGIATGGDGPGGADAVVPVELRRRSR